MVKIFMASYPLSADAERRGRFWAVPVNLRGIKSVAVSPDGAQLVAGGSNGTACVYDAYTGAMIGVHEESGGAIVSVAFSSDRAWAVVQDAVLLPGGESCTLRV